MELSEKIIKKKNDDYLEIVALMKRVFPKEELFPMWSLLLLAKKKNCQFITFYDKDLFVGLSYLIECKETLYIKYLAVNDNVHSKGYGSKILQIIKAKSNNKPITFLIETLDNDADNHEQRIKRLDFYNKNGFYQTGVKAGFKVPFVDVLSNQSELSKENLRVMLPYLPLKFY